jgi:hypothetical protein
VHFYEEDAEFLDSVSEYVGSALGAGGACILIATRAHRRGIADRLTAWGMDLKVVSHNNRYITLDAEETLARFMVDGWPDEMLFQNAVELEMLRAKSGLVGRAGSIVAFGEMVVLLWKAGNCEAAIHLERLWNALAVQRRIFVPFFTTKPDVGTGIGLWVTKCLIEQQGGYLRFRSRQGKNGGTVMSFFVPRTPGEYAVGPKAAA